MARCTDRRSDGDWPDHRGSAGSEFSPAIGETTDRGVRGQLARAAFRRRLVLRLIETKLATEGTRIHTDQHSSIQAEEFRNWRRSAEITLAGPPVLALLHPAPAFLLALDSQLSALLASPAPCTLLPAFSPAQLEYPAVRGREVKEPSSSASNPLSRRRRRSGSDCRGSQDRCARTCARTRCRRFRASCCRGLWWGRGRRNPGRPFGGAAGSGRRFHRRRPPGGQRGEDVPLLAPNADHKKWRGMA